MLTFTTVIVILAICLFYLRRLYKIPSFNTIKEIVSNSSISGIEITSKFFKIRTLSYNNKKVAIKPKPIVIAKAKPIIKITSKMVGTFTYAEQPEYNSVIHLGKEVEENELIGFITALGIASEINAPKKGRIIQIITKDHQPVEYGQLIMLIEEL